MKNSISQNAEQNNVEIPFLLSVGVNASSPTKTTKPRAECLVAIVESFADKNGDLQERTRFVDPATLPNPLEGLVYDPSCMSLSAQFANGVALPEAKLGNMYSDPLEAEQQALYQYDSVNHAVELNAQKQETSTDQNEVTSVEANEVKNETTTE